MGVGKYHIHISVFMIVAVGTCPSREEEEENSSRKKGKPMRRFPTLGKPPFSRDGPESRGDLASVRGVRGEGRVLLRFGDRDSPRLGEA
jgi:hypothetical protein